MSRVEPLELVVTALHAGKCKPHRSDTGYTAHCPAHDDRNPSLSVNTGDDGRVLLKCHAGCTLEAILQALNLDPGDLFARSNLECPKPPVTVETIKYVEVVPKDAPSPPENHPKLRQPTMKWVYRASNGWPAFLVLRFDDDRGKTIRPLTLWRKNGGLTWKWKAPPAPRPLFALPALASRAGGSSRGRKPPRRHRLSFPIWSSPRRPVDRRRQGKPTGPPFENEPLRSGPTTTRPAYRMRRRLHPWLVKRAPRPYRSSGSPRTGLPDGILPINCRLESIGTTWRR